jgi:hypothetical protein
MKRATVVCTIDPFNLGAKFATPQTVEGYACSIAGIDMVVHRAPRYDDEPSTNAWTVTEPVTGRAVVSSGTRREALHAAEERIAFAGGPDAVRREIEKHGPAPERS